MICPYCGHTEGNYYEYEDYDYEWVLWQYTSWYCHGCNDTVSQYHDSFVWPDE